MERSMTDDELRATYPELAKRYDELMKKFGWNRRNRSARWICRILAYGEGCGWETDPKTGIEYSWQDSPKTGDKREEWYDPKTGITRIEFSNKKTGEHWVKERSSK